MKKQLILVFALVLYGALQAQQTGSFIDFNVGGGYHNLSYSLQNGTQKGRVGYTLNAGYSFFFTPKWGLHTGLGFQSFNSLSTLNYLSTTPDIDTEGVGYDFSANYKNWQEKQQALMIDIPLAVMFKQPISPKLGLLASVGGKISFPVNGSYKSNGGELVTSGYYIKWNVPLSDMPQHGFSTMTNHFSGNTTFKTAFMGIADLGGLYKLSEKLDLYVGAYLNYGLNNILNPGSQLIYQPKANSGVYNGMLASTQTNSVTPIAVGVKVGVYLHLGEQSPIVESESLIEPKQPVAPTEPAPPVEPVTPVPPVESAPVVEPAAPVQPVPTIEPVPAVVAVPPVEPAPAVEPVAPVQPVPTIEPVPAVVVVPPVEPAPAVEPVAPVQPVTPIEPVPVVVAIPPVSAVEPTPPVPAIQPVETPQPVVTTPPAKEAVVAEQAPTVVEAPVQKPVETPVQPKQAEPVQVIAKPEPVHTGDPFEDAKRIAESMNIMFGFNSAQVIESKNSMIGQLSDILKANSSIHVRLVGHTCNIGTHKINKALGMKRAINVKRKFTKHGVTYSQLKTESMAYDQPLVPNTSPKNRARNRRVQIVVIWKD